MIVFGFNIIIYLSILQQYIFLHQRYGNIHWFLV